MAGATLIEGFAVGVPDAALAVVADHGEGVISAVLKAAESLPVFRHQRTF